MECLKCEATSIAIDEYDKTASIREALFEAVRTNDDVIEWVQAEKEAVDKVRRAFYEDTKDRNSKSACMIVDIHTMRQLV